MSKRQRQPDRPAPGTPGDNLRTIYGTDFAAALGALDRLRDQLDDREHSLITGQRHAGATWAQIGVDLGGITRQAVQKRFTTRPGQSRAQSRRRVGVS